MAVSIHRGVGALGLLVLTGGCLQPTEGYLGPAEGNAGPCEPAGARGSELSELATSLERGQWAELRTMNFVDALLAGQGDWSLLNTNAGVWDPAARQAYLLGVDFLVYDEQSNAWSMHPVPCDPCFEGRDHTTIDGQTSRLFHRQFGSRTVQQLSPGASAWESLEEIPSQFQQCCNGLEYFPARGELVFADAGGIYLYSFADQQWSHPWGEIGLVDRVIIEHSTVHELMLILGDTDAEVFTLDRDAQVRQMAPPPFDLEVGSVVVTPDLVTGNFLVLVQPDTWFIYDPVADTWEPQPDPPAPLVQARDQVASNLVAVPVPDYCVTMFAAYDFDASSVWLYRHGT